MSYIGTRPTVGNFVKLDTITTSATTTFNLLNGGVAYYPQSANHCLVSLNGILQAPTDSFTISGSTIIFSSALTTSDVIDFIIVLGDVLNIGTPCDNTVSLAKLTATGTKDATTFLRGDNTFAVPAGGVNTPAFAVHASADQTITSSTNTQVVFGTELLDTDNAFTSNQFTVPTGKGGEYFLYSNIYFYGGSTNNIDNLQFSIQKNGTNVVHSVHNSGANNSQDVSVHISAIVNLSAGDVVKVMARPVTTSGDGYIVNTTGANRFGGFRLIQ